MAAVKSKKILLKWYEIIEEKVPVWNIQFEYEFPFQSPFMTPILYFKYNFE